MVNQVLFTDEFYTIDQAKEIFGKSCLSCDNFRDNCCILGIYTKKIYVGMENTDLEINETFVKESRGIDYKDQDKCKHYIEKWRNLDLKEGSEPRDIKSIKENLVFISDKRRKIK